MFSLIPKFSFIHQYQQFKKVCTNYFNTSPLYKKGIGFSRNQRTNNFRIWIDEDMMNKSYVDNQWDVFGNEGIIDNLLSQRRIDIIECWALCDEKSKNKFFYKSLEKQEEFLLNFKNNTNINYRSGAMNDNGLTDEINVNEDDDKI